MGWVQQSESTFTATQGITFHGSDLGLSGYLGRVDFICSNITPLDPSIAGEASINLGVIASEPIGAEVPDGILSIWVIYEQEQSPPGTPVPPGDSYQWNGIGNTVPSDSGGFSPLGEAGWEDVELEVQLTGTAPYDPTGDTFEVICRVYEWETTPFSDYDALPTESGDPGDPGYLAFPDPVAITEGEVNRGFLTLEWGFTPDPAEPDGFAIFDVGGPDFPTPVALIPDPDARSYAFPEPFTRDQVQQLAVTAYIDGVKKSQLGGASIDNIVVELAPAPGIMPIGSVGNFYSLQFTASNGLTPDATFTYAVTGGAIPDGTTLDTNTGLISGIPTLQGDYNFEITASSDDVTSSLPPGAWIVNIQLIAPLWTMEPPSGSDVEPGETITIEGPEGDFEATDENGNTAPLKGPTYEVPYPPQGPCFDCLTTDCPECQDCAQVCAEDINSHACQECMQACLDCLTACLEDLMEAEDCQETIPGTTITVHGGRQFGGTVPLGTLTILTTEASGIYKFTLGKKNDTIYRAARDGTTYDVKIPNPGAQTGFFKA